MPTPLAAIVRYARQNSPYYRQLYANLPQTGWQLRALPLIDPQNFWQGSSNIDNWPVLTGPVLDGLVFKTGGSSGDGKLSIYAREEWQHFVRQFGQGMSKSLQAGDRVANLFFAGDLYASLLFIHGALRYSSVPICEFPFTGAVDDQSLASAINEYNITVLAGVPVQLVRFANWLNQAGCSVFGVRCIMYGGESLFANQREVLEKAFPKACITSIGCASVDAGLIGACLPDCEVDEHWVFDGDILVEIVDETTGEVIDDVDRVGVLVVTNLQRLLMPIVRYPTGDLACWRSPLDTAVRKFALRGRAGGGHRIRVGTLSLFPDMIDKALNQLVGPTTWQMVLTRQDDLDQLTLQIADDVGPPSIKEDTLIDGLRLAFPALANAQSSGQIALCARYLPSSAMFTHARSGKLVRVVDQRPYYEVEA
ncbi:phenylacetate--CoA ligase family protein [Ensifer sp. SL37]|uniref:phenylacetate--CoA ligase family protein n=1 Tax=Ensifer sp. SL37 TaxID=2995137 RepID=UPI002272A0EA|nr:hypothetical protein [Ensifer sp. SL37]MCY1740485.1 hypothetical protein [Ensifer sp. SL37]